ncbi:M56/M15 family metallopeptidase [Sediminibacterium sp.]|uniref:M56/M15 family metallopeptidase n=1 Tax=Sediminibacterium sp. TaxID=1917865 RepID=UPI0025E3A5A6|nr:M56/M15 family metallopeptidase [Sediminibacterium sp.]MBW0176512.1 N-acetylmuramoyl-L-alanine amidase [Sediminibacterium sp.]
MLSTAYYFLQVILCSAIMMGYYWIALRNKKFHQYNRFYLLAVALFSWTVPLIKIQWVTAYANQQQVIRFLSVVADNNSEIEAVIGSKGFHWSMERIMSVVYVLVATCLLAALISAFYRIYQLLKTHSCKKVGEVFLIITQAKGTPFSFFRYIFWNEEIDIRSASGKQILQHELTHVQQKHSVDKLLIQVMLIPGWLNPFFWLLKKEMDMIHEFIADKKAVQDGDTAALAQMLLTAVYPKHHFELTHPFFFSPIKRRLQMLTNHKNPRFSYIRRLVILPLLAVVIVLFAFRNKEYRAKHPISVKNVLESVINDVNTSQQSGVTIKDIDLEDLAPMKLSKTYRIVINPGHGGEDVGARAVDGTTESALTLQLAKMLKEKNTNPQLEIVLTRNADEFHTVVQVAEKTNALSPDLFISLHMNSAATVRRKGEAPVSNPAKGTEIYLADKTKTFDYNKSYQLANWMGNFLTQAGTSFQGIKSRNKGIYVLQTIKCPSVLLEAGYMTNKDEALLLKSEAYQAKIAMAILHGIEQYLAAVEGKTADTNGEPSSKTNPSFEFGAKTAVVMNDKAGNIQSIKLEGNPYFKFPEQYQSMDGLLYFLNGEKISYNQLNDLEPNTIQKINIIKDPAALKIFTDEDVKGVVLITTKQAVNVKAHNEDNTERKEPVNYIITVVNDRPIINEIKVLYLHNDLPTVEGYDLKDPVKRSAFAKKFAGENGVDKIVKDAENYYSGIKGIKNTKPAVLSMQVEYPADFPGGELAWQKYLVKNLNRDIPVEKGAGPGTYVVKVTFVVEPTGIIKDVKVKQDPGFGTAAEVVRIITKGPNWRPALYKQKAVASLIEKKVTFVISDESDEPVQKEQVKDVVLETVYVDPQIPPSFPGGLAAWAKYLERNLDANLVKKKGGPPGKYTVVLNFVVDENGKISNVRSNNPGYGTREEAVRIIEKGPNWKPAINKGKPVKAEHKLSITFNHA